MPGARFAAFVVTDASRLLSLHARVKCCLHVPDGGERRRELRGRGGDRVRTVRRGRLRATLPAVFAGLRSTACDGTSRIMRYHTPCHRTPRYTAPRCTPRLVVSTSRRRHFPTCRHFPTSLVAVSCVVCRCCVCAGHDGACGARSEQRHAASPSRNMHASFIDSVHRRPCPHKTQKITSKVYCK